eukprot:2625083-Pyramimonas_sp.AAC.1
MRWPVHLGLPSPKKSPLRWATCRPSPAPAFPPKAASLLSSGLRSRPDPCWCCPCRPPAQGNDSAQLHQPADSTHSRHTARRTLREE